MCSALRSTIDIRSVPLVIVLAALVLGRRRALKIVCELQRSLTTSLIDFSTLRTRSSSE